MPVIYHVICPVIYHVICPSHLLQSSIPSHLLQSSIPSHLPQSFTLSPTPVIYPSFTPVIYLSHLPQQPTSAIYPQSSTPAIYPSHLPQPSTPSHLPQQPTLAICLSLAGASGRTYHTWGDDSSGHGLIRVIKGGESLTPNCQHFHSCLSGLLGSV